MSDPGGSADRGTVEDEARCAACERSSSETLIFTCCAAHDAAMCGDCYNRNHSQPGYSSNEFNAFHDGWAAANKASGVVELKTAIERLLAEPDADWRGNRPESTVLKSRLRSLLAESGTPKEGEAGNG